MYIVELFQLCFNFLRTFLCLPTLFCSTSSVKRTLCSLVDLACSTIQAFEHSSGGVNGGCLSLTSVCVCVWGGGGGGGGLSEDLVPSPFFVKADKVHSYIQQYIYRFSVTNINYALYNVIWKFFRCCNICMHIH